MSSFRVCVPVLRSPLRSPLHSPLHSPETPSESVMTELAPHASYEKPCTGGPESERSYRWPPRFPTPYSASSAEFLALVTARVPGRSNAHHSSLPTPPLPLTHHSPLITLHSSLRPPNSSAAFPSSACAGFAPGSCARRTAIRM